MNKPPARKISGNKPAVLKISRSATKTGPSQTLGPFPRSKKPLSSARTSRSQSILETKGHLCKTTEPKSSNQTSTTPVPVQIQGPFKQKNKPVSSDQASTSPKPVQTPGRKTSVTASSEQPSTSCDRSRTQESLPKTSAIPTRGPVPKTKIPVLSDSRTRGSTSTSPVPVKPPVLKANKPKVTGRAFGSTFSLPTQRVKAPEPLTTTRTPTSPDILQNRPRTKASGSVFSGFRNRGSFSTSPSYIRIPKVTVPVWTSPSYIRSSKTSVHVSTSASYIRSSKTSLPVNPDRATAGTNRFQTRGPKGRKPVSSVSKSAFRSPGSVQTRGPLPKSKKLTSSVSKNRVESESSKRVPATAVPAKSPGPKPNESVASANKNQDFASRRPPGNLRSNKSRIPTCKGTSIGQASGIHDDEIETLYTKPEFRLKQTQKSLPSTCPDPALALQIELADELDRRSSSIKELEMKLAQNQNLESEQALLLAESKAVQRAKDVALEQLKSELLMAKDEYDRMHLRLREADLGLEQATCKVNKYLERSNSMEDELKEARDKINNLQRELKDADTKAAIHSQSKDQLRQDVERMQEQVALDSKKIQHLQKSEKDLREDLENRDRLITQISLELATRDEEFRNLFETLKNTHTQLRSQELSFERLKERYERGSLHSSKLEKRNATLQKANDKLKNDLRHYSQMIIANDGKPFFEEVPPCMDPNIADGLVPSP